jgi:hypothetical protein
MQRALYSLLVVGVAGAVILAWILGEFYRLGIISITTNSQIVSQTTPCLVDLWAALTLLAPTTSMPISRPRQLLK